MDPHTFYQKQSILSLDSIWKLRFLESESSSDPFTYHRVGHSAEYGSSRQGVGSEKQKAGIIRIEVPYKAKLAVGIGLIVCEEAPILRSVTGKDSLLK